MCNEYRFSRIPATITTLTKLRIKKRASTMLAVDKMKEPRPVKFFYQVPVDRPSFLNVPKSRCQQEVDNTNHAATMFSYLPDAC